MAEQGRSNPYAIGIWKPLLVFVVFSLSIAAGGYFVFQHYKESVKSDKQSELGGIAEIKIRQITDWMAERRNDAQALADDLSFTTAAGDWLRRGGAAGEAGAALSAHLSALQQSHAAYGITAILLFDEKATLHLSSSGDVTSIPAGEQELLLESMRTGQIIAADLHRERHRDGEMLEIDLAVPLSAVQSGRTHTIGAVLFRIDPARFLFPLVQRWPTASVSAETLLVRRDGDTVLFLNQLRHRSNNELAMRLPLDPKLPAAMAVLGQQGVVEGTDYRGVPVVAVLNKVPGTQWFMVSKMDQAEIDIPINRLADRMLLLMLSIIGIGVGIAVYWRKKEIRYQQEKLEQQRLTQMLLYLSRNANDIILLHDGAGRIVDFNDRALAAYGYSAEELSGKSMQFLLAAEFSSGFAQRCEELGRAGAARFESMHVRKDGTPFPVETSVRGFDVAGEKYYQAIIRDITERKRAEEQLRRSEQGLAEAQRLAQLGNWELNLVNNVLAWSAENYRIFEIDPEKFGASYEAFLDRVHPDDRDIVSQAYTSSVRDKTPYDIVHRLQMPDGRIKYVNEICETYYREDGKPLRSIGTTHDITGRVLVEQELHKQKMLLWQVMDTDPSHIFVKDAEGNFLLVNHSAAAVHGMTPKEMVGRNQAEVCPLSEDVAASLQADREVIEKWHELNRVELNTLHDGEQRWMLTLKRRLTMPDGKLGVLTIAVDITEQKHAEMKLARSYQELQLLAMYLENVRADEREKIALNLHDEMGATLAAIKMGVAWLASKLPAEAPQLAAETASIAELVSGGIQTMRQIVTQLRPNLLADVGLAAAAKDYVEKFGQHTNIECTLELPDEELTLDADRALTLFRILQESLSNVLKHAQASRIEIVFAILDGSLTMVVQDNGIGFDQGERKEQSFGLLGIRERALMVGGKARIASTPGKGTRVSVSVPMPDFVDRMMHNPTDSNSNFAARS